MTTEELTRVAFQKLLGMEPRKADIAVLEVLVEHGTIPDNVAEYIWDHIMGEPDEPTLEQVTAEVQKLWKEVD